jgi:hypothetical protein
MNKGATGVRRDGEWCACAVFATSFSNSIVKHANLGASVNVVRSGMLVSLLAKASAYRGGEAADIIDAEYVSVRDLGCLDQVTSVAGPATSSVCSPRPWGSALHQNAFAFLPCETDY